MNWNWEEFNKATAWGCGLAIGLGMALAFGKAIVWIVEAL